MYQIFFDAFQEGQWFQSQHQTLSNAELLPFPSNNEIVKFPIQFQNALSMDRPDIILCQNFIPILVVERTVEVPSGHNVGQRFARMVAAAKHQIPSIYKAPYAARKHGGETEGPRYINLRLKYAFEKMSKQHNDISITMLNWPVDNDYEIIRDHRKDVDIKEYLNEFFKVYNNYNLIAVSNHINKSALTVRINLELDQFIDSKVKRPSQYDAPPPSVRIISATEFCLETNITNQVRPVVVYKIGMKKIRSDPYTGCAYLYAVLYCNGISRPDKDMCLHMEHISFKSWKELSGNNNRKDIRLYKAIADFLYLKDAILNKSQF